MCAAVHCGYEGWQVISREDVNVANCLFQGTNRRRGDGYATLKRGRQAQTARERRGGVLVPVSMKECRNESEAYFLGRACGSTAEWSLW